MKLNKYLILFVGLFVGLNTLLFVVLQKYFPLFLHHVIYYCQEMAKTLAFRLPGNIGMIIFSLLLLAPLTAFVKFVLTIAKIYRFRKHLSGNSIKDASLTKVLDKLNLESRVAIVNSSKPYALCFGVRDPKIYLSTKLMAMLSTKELEVVLRHEKYHLEHRDTLTLMLATIFESLLPFFPLISDLIKQYRIERELLADKAASVGIEGNKHLSSILTKLLKHEPSFAFVIAPALADIDTLEARIKRLANIPIFSRKFDFKNVVISLLSIGFLFLLALTPVNATELHTQDHDVIMICTSGSECTSHCGENATVSPVSKVQNASTPFTPATH